MLYRQVELSAGDQKMVVNIEDRPTIKVGNLISLKDYRDPKLLWRIDWVAEKPREKKSIKTNWNNNI